MMLHFSVSVSDINTAYLVIQIGQKVRADEVHHEYLNINKQNYKMIFQYNMHLPKGSTTKTSDDTMHTPPNEKMIIVSLLTKFQ